MFKKLLSSIGIGAAKVDTKLSKSRYAPGEMLEGIVEVHGGNVEQQIDEIYLALMSTYIREVDDKKYEEKIVLKKYKVMDSFTIILMKQKRSLSSLFFLMTFPLQRGKRKSGFKPV
jgi:sporulation-control protein